MQQYVTPERVANAIAMTRRSHRGSYLVVEGPTDSWVYTGLVDPDACRIEIAFSRSSAEKVIRLVGARGIRGVLAIVDADYSALNGHEPRQECILFTDDHDLETMLLRSPALNKVLRMVLPNDRITEADRLAARAREALLRIGTAIGYLRWLNDRENLGIGFDDLPYDKLVDEDSLSVDTAALRRAIRRNGRRGAAWDRDLEAKLRELMRRKVDPWQVCQGHDLVSILSAILPALVRGVAGHAAGNHRRCRLHPEDLARRLSLAYEAAFFYDTRLYRAIRDWEQANPPYLVLTAG